MSESVVPEPTAAEPTAAVPVVSEPVEKKNNYQFKKYDGTEKEKNPLVMMRKLHGDKVTNISDENDSNVGGKKKTKKRKSSKKKTKKKRKGKRKGGTKKLNTTHKKEILKKI